MTVGIKIIIILAKMIFTTLQILFTLNCTTPIIKEYNLEQNKICYVLDLGIKIKDNNFKSDTKIINSCLDSVNYLLVIVDNRKEKEWGLCGRKPFLNIGMT